MRSPSHPLMHVAQETIQILLLDASRLPEMSAAESHLLLRAAQGNAGAFEEFVRFFERRVRAVLGRVLDDERDVDEAAQDTFVQVWRSLPGFRGDAAPSTWVYRIAVNEALQRVRRKKLITRPLEDVPGLDRGIAPGGAARPLPADVAAENHELQQFIASRLRNLPFEYRVPIVLRDIEGWSTTEVAELLEISTTAVKSRLHRARMQLRHEIDVWLQGQGLPPNAA